MKNKIIAGLKLMSLWFIFINSAIYTTDYRDSHIGRYFCNRNCQVVSSDRSKLEIQNDTLTIWVTKNPSDSILNIIVNNNTFKVKLMGLKLIPYPNRDHWGGHFFGEDSIGFAVSIGKVSNICTYRGKSIK